MLRGFDHDPRHHLGGEQADDRQQIAGPVVLQQQREKYRRRAEHHQPRVGSTNFTARSAGLSTPRVCRKWRLPLKKIIRPINIPIPARAKPICQPYHCAASPQAMGAAIEPTLPAAYSSETAVATRVVVSVQFAEQAADIGFKQAVAADNDRQRDVQTPCGGRLNAQHHMAEGHQQRPGNYRRAVAEQAVGKPAAENRVT